MQIIKEIAQGSPEWQALRLGKVTASRFSDVMAKGKAGAPSKTRQSYLYELAAERITGLVQDSYSNSYMQWGTETEPNARAFYEFEQDIATETVAFIMLNDDVGGSPDSLVGDEGLLEIKCPKTTVQIERVLEGVFPSEYKAQVQGLLWVSGRKWCDFVSFDPRINSDKKYFKIRVERDGEYINNLEIEVTKFVEELHALVKKLGGI